MRQVYHIVTDFNKCKIPIFTLSFLKQSIFYFKLYYIFEKIKSFFLFFRKKGIIKENKQLQNKRKKLISQQKEEERKKRVRRLYEKGGVFESIFTESKNLTKDEFYQLITFQNIKEAVNQKILKIIEKREQCENQNTENQEEEIETEE